MELSVVIPTYNRAAYLEQALASLQRQTMPSRQFEAIVVDDGSRDQTKQVCEKFSSQLSLKYLYQEHRGVSVARNLGWRKAQAPVVVFFDDDALAAADWLEQIALAMTKEMIITGRVLPRQKKFWNYFAPHYYQGDQVKASPVLLEGNCAINKEVFVKIGEFDQTLDYGHEGREFIERCRQSYQISYYPQVVIYHDYAFGIKNYLGKQFIFGEKLVYLKRTEIKSLSDLIFNYQKLKKAKTADQIPNILVKQLSGLTWLLVKIVGRLGSACYFWGAVGGYFKFIAYAKN